MTTKSDPVLSWVETAVDEAKDSSNPVLAVFGFAGALALHFLRGSPDPLADMKRAHDTHVKLDAAEANAFAAIGVADPRKSTTHKSKEKKKVIIPGLRAGVESEAEEPLTPEEEATAAAYRDNTAHLQKLSGQIKAFSKSHPIMVGHAPSIAIPGDTADPSGYGRKYVRAGDLGTAHEQVIKLSANGNGLEALERVLRIQRLREDIATFKASVGADPEGFEMRYFVFVKDGEDLAQALQDAQAEIVRAYYNAPQ